MADNVLNGKLERLRSFSIFESWPDE